MEHDLLHGFDSFLAPQIVPFPFFSWFLLWFEGYNHACLLSVGSLHNGLVAISPHEVLEYHLSGSAKPLEFVQTFLRLFKQFFEAFLADDLAENVLHRD